jgi:hypothetical protein
MVVESIGINMSAIATVTPPVNEFANMTATQFINYVPANANTMTGDYYAIILLFTLIIFLTWKYTEQGQFGDYRLSINRGFGAALGIANIFGIVMLSCGFATNLRHIIILNTLFLIMLIWTILKNPE